MFIHCAVWYSTAGRFSMTNTLCLLRHLISATTPRGRSSSYHSFTDKKLWALESLKNLLEVIGARFASFWPPLYAVFWCRGESTGTRAKSPGLKVQLHTYWHCSLGQVASCLWASISSTLKWGDGNCPIYLSGLLWDSNLTMSVKSDSTL